MGARYKELSSSSYPYEFWKLPRAFVVLLIVTTLLVAGLILLNLWSQRSCPAVTVQSNKLEYRGVAESMDGIGYSIKKNSAVILDPRFDSFYSLPLCNDSVWNPKVLIDIPGIMATFRECMTAHVDSFKYDVPLIEHRWEKNVTVCEKRLDFGDLRFDEFKNQHESKWAVLPKCQEEHIMVTFGVGHEVSAETSLNRTLPNVKFFGVDPIIEPNIQLYSPLGTFFPFAVGKQAGMNRFRVLPNQNQRTRKYLWQDVTTIEVIYVLKEIMHLSWIDFFWIDIEGGEIGFLDYFFKGGKFDQNGITICQFNVELHPHYVEQGAQTFYEFVDQLVKDGRYVFMKARNTGVGVTRLYFLNMQNSQCVRKFLSS